MNLFELYQQSVSNKQIDLQALIMFLVMEKKVLTFEDDVSELELYFLDKHKDRMNYELVIYKQKMKLHYDPFVFELKLNERVVYVMSPNYALLDNFIKQKGWKVHEVNLMYDDRLMYYNNNAMKIKDIPKSQEVKILGGY